MRPAGLALAAVAALALVAYVLWIYRRRELPVRGRGALAALRALVVVAVLLLVFDPPLPGRGPLGGGSERLLVDGSLSMGSGPGSPWSRATEEVARRGGLPVLVFGEDRARPGPVEDSAPGLPSTLLTPALERAAEAGARRLVVVSDLRIEDAGEAAAAAERLGLEVEVVDVGADVSDAAILSFDVPPAVAAGEPVQAEVAVGATGGIAGDTATVEVREEGRLVASRTVTLPGPGRRTIVELELPPPGSRGAVRYEASLVGGDAWPDDDVRPAWTEVDPEEGAVVLVGVEPDWEPRFLLPVLGRVTGLRTRGLLRVAPDRWLVMDEGGAAGTVDDARAAREARGAAVLVVQGGAEGGPSWLGDAVEGASRSIVLASGPEEAALAGVETGPPMPGEWYASPEIPSSPLAAELSGVALDGLPPLGPLLPLRDTAAAVVPLRARRGAGGAPEAALVLRSGPGGRRAVALAPGWWRWPLRSDAGRDAYRRLWAGVAGWLLAEETAAGPGLRPAVRVVPRGAPVEWSAGGSAGDTVSLTVTRGDSAVLDTTAAVPESGRLTTRPLPPGRYEWTASTGATDGGPSGAFDVEAWTDELLHPRATDLARAPAGAGPAGDARGGRSLRTHPLPYLIVLGLLSAEWVFRRRRGLR